MKDDNIRRRRMIPEGNIHSLSRIIIAVLLICALCIPVAGADVHAASAVAQPKAIGWGEYLANESEMDFDYKRASQDYSYIYAADENSELSTVTSDNPKVATVSAVTNLGNTDQYVRTYVIVTPKAAGTTYMTITDVQGRVTKMKVVVTKAYFKANFKNNTNVYMTYGRPYYTVYTKPYAKIRLTLAGRTRVKKANKYGEAAFTMNKVYRIGTKYKVKVYWHKMKLSYSKKILASKPYAYTDTYWSCKYYLPFHFISMTKGDKVTLYIGNEKYSFTAPYTTGTYAYTFYTKYTIRNYSSMRVVIKNKFKQKLYDNTFAITWN